MAIEGSAGGSRVDTATSIIVAARQCFDRSGIAATTVEDVVRELGISRTTFYRHFPGIDAVIVKITIDEIRSLLESAIAAVEAEPSWTNKLRGVVTGVTMSLSENHWMQMMGVKGETIPTTIMVHSAQGAMGTIEAPLVSMLEVGRRLGALNIAIDPIEGAEWMMRAAWSLSVVPNEPPWTVDSLEVYVEKFVIKGLLSIKTLLSSDKSTDSVAGTKLDAVLEATARIERHLGIGSAAPAQSLGSRKLKTSTSKKQLGSKAKLSSKK